MSDNAHETGEAKTLFVRCSAAKHRNESSFLAALAHASKDLHLDVHGYDQWHLPLVLTTFLAYLLLRRWDHILVLFVVYYMLEFAYYVIVMRLTRCTTASITRHRKRYIEMLTDPLFFASALFVAWYVVDYSVIGRGVRDRPAEWWRSASVIAVSLLSGHARLFWSSLLALVAVIWLSHAIALIDTDSHSRHAYSLWLSLHLTGISLFFYFVFIAPLGGHYGQNAILALLLALFFSSALHFISLDQ